MEEIWAFLLLHRIVVSGVLAVLLTLILIKIYWDKVSFWWLCTWMSFPLIGGIASLSRNHTKKDRWFQSERTLCSKFYRYYISCDKDPGVYLKSVSYLNKVDEAGRSPFPLFMWIIVFSLVIAEALGFAYVLAGWTIPGASESLQAKGAVGIAFVISIILVGLTHFTGEEMYKNSQIKKVREFFKTEKGNGTIKLIPNSKVTLEDNEIDDDEPRCLQILNRLKNAPANANLTIKSHVVSIITAVAIIVIAIGATYVRGQVLEKQLIQEVSNVTTNVYETAPAELAEAQTNADNKALQDEQNADRKGGWATFIVLAFLFVFIQILGILFGFKWGFAGKKSKEAYYYSHAFMDSGEFEDFYNNKKDKVASIAGEKLSALQSKMANGISNSTIDSTDLDMVEEQFRTFENYVREKKDAETARKIHEAMNKTATKAGTKLAQEVGTKQAENMVKTAPQTKAEPEPTQTTAPQVEPINNFAKVIQEIKSKAQEAFDRDDDALSSALKQVRKSLEAASGAEEAAKILKEQASKAFDDDNEELAAILKHARKTLES